MAEEREENKESEIEILESQGCPPLSRKERAVALFHAGYNCSQSVFAAYSDIYGMDEETALRVAASFGAGIGRMREVCGAASGMFMIAGLENGSIDGKDVVGKKKNYELVQQMAEEFKDRAGGTMICRELLGVGKKPRSTTPDERTKEYYQKRPCVQLVEDAADIIEQFIPKAKQDE